MTPCSRPHDGPTIDTKWIFRNKLDELGNIIRNKARLVVQGITKSKASILKKNLAPIARLDAIRMTLAFVSFKDFKFFQMGVKSAFLNGFIEKVYVKQPLGFVDPTHPDFVFKLEKAYMV